MVKADKLSFIKTVVMIISFLLVLLVPALVPANIFATIHYLCQYGDDGLNQTCIINHFRPGQAKYELINPTNATRIIFINAISPVVPRNLFTQHTAIESLNLSSAAVEQLTKSAFDGAGRLRKLNLSNNALEVVNTGVFKRAANLTHLDLSHNVLELLEYEAFKYLTQLLELDLSNNRVKHISKHAFVDLYRLMALRLDGNRLKTLNGALKPLRGLQTLSLEDNQLNYIRIKDLQRMENLTTVTMAENQWYCQGLTLILDFLDAGNVTHDLESSNGKCIEELPGGIGEKELKEIQKLKLISHMYFSPLTLLDTPNIATEVIVACVVFLISLMVFFLIVFCFSKFSY